MISTPVLFNTKSPKIHSLDFYLTTIIYSEYLGSPYYFPPLIPLSSSNFVSRLKFVNPCVSCHHNGNIWEEEIGKINK